MRPPICRICDKTLEGVDDGGLIYFKKRPSDIKWEEKMEKIRGTGHPPNAEWFCEKHYDEASNLKNLPIDKALKKLIS
jgi:hypothetical protein